MPSPAACLLALTVLLGPVSCGQAVDDPLGDLAALVANREAGSLSLIRDTHPLSVSNDPIQVGAGPGQVLTRGDELVVLNCDDGDLAVVDLENWQVLRRYPLGSGCGPRMMALTSDRLLVVTCFVANQLLLVNPDLPGGSDAVLDRLDMPDGEALSPYDPSEPGQSRPRSLAVIGHRAFVTLSNLHDDLQPAGPGMVLVADLASWTGDKLIELPGEDPLAVHRPEYREERLYFGCRSGVVEILDTADDVLLDSVPTGGRPGRLWEDPQGVVWVADRSEGRLMCFDSESYDLLEPLALCPGGEPVGDVAGNGKGRVFATCSGSDAIQSFLRSDPESTMMSLAVGDGPGALLVFSR